jgi:hypothetical protein
MVSPGPSAEEELPVPKVPGSSSELAAEEAAIAPVESKADSDEEEKQENTPDAFDVALNKIFGGEIEDSDRDKSGSAGESSSGTGQ